MESLCEGFFIITKDELIFEVKGNVHPSNRVIAYLRYVPDENGQRSGAGQKRYTKIYDIEKRNSFLEVYHPEYLWFDPFRKRSMQSVPNDHVAFVLNPIDGLRQLRDHGAHLTLLEENTIELADTLIDISGIPSDAIGVTGSQLVRLATSKSDIDLVVYGESNCKSVFHALKEKRDTLPKLKQYSRDLLERHVEFRWGASTPWKDWLLQAEKDKVLQGLFGGYEFFIRLVKYPDEMRWKYEERFHHYIKHDTFRCLIVDDSQSIFTPCEYQVSCESEPDLRRIVSFRGRYTEHVSSGMYVETKGRLERVDFSQGHSELHLILGETSNDYLIPVDQLKIDQ